MIMRKYSNGWTKTEKGREASLPTSDARPFSRFSIFFRLPSHASFVNYHYFILMLTFSWVFLLILSPAHTIWPVREYYCKANTIILYSKASQGAIRDAMVKICLLTWMTREPMPRGRNRGSLPWRPLRMGEISHERVSVQLLHFRDRCLSFCAIFLIINHPASERVLKIPSTASGKIPVYNWKGRLEADVLPMIVACLPALFQYRLFFLLEFYKYG